MFCMPTATLPGVLISVWRNLPTFNTNELYHISSSAGADIVSVHARRQALHHALRDCGFTDAMIHQGLTHDCRPDVMRVPASLANQVIDLIKAVEQDGTIPAAAKSARTATATFPIKEQLRARYLGPRCSPLYIPNRFLFYQRRRPPTVIGRRPSSVLDAEASLKKQEPRDLKDIIKDHSPPIQVSMIEAYRRGMEASNEKEYKKKRLGYWTWLVVRSVLFGVLLYVVIIFFRSTDKMKGVFPKFIDAGVVNIAENVGVTFDDVQGCDEVKKELADVVDFLRNPDKFNRLGAHLPKGVLLVGPPGVGKTLLARAVAGEAKVPFFFVSGSNFEEVFVGLGASRVRQLFSTAKRHAPCVIFIDEIDSVGRTRTSSPHHPYANQTINQLLAEMDGFQNTEGIIVLGATNKKDDLDRAILRPGRFDFEVQVGLPDVQGRMALLKLYLGKVQQGSDISLEKLAHGTVGYTGADIQNLVNQAAIGAGLKGDMDIRMQHLWEARDRLIMGPARKRPMDEQANKIAAFHEAGHALVAYLTQEAIPIHKVTIIPRGDSGGHTSFLPEKDIRFFTRSQLKAQLDVMMGGRIGEEMAFGADRVTTGASDDFKQATHLAQNMVQRFGLSDRVGPRVVSPIDPLSGSQDELSQATREVIDREVDLLLTDSMERVRKLLAKYADQHRTLAEALLEHETLNKDEVDAVMKGKPRLLKAVRNLI